MQHVASSLMDGVTTYNLHVRCSLSDALHLNSPYEARSLFSVCYPCLLSIYRFFFFPSFLHFVASLFLQSPTVCFSIPLNVQPIHHLSTQLDRSSATPMQLPPYTKARKGGGDERHRGNARTHAHSLTYAHTLTQDHMTAALRLEHMHSILLPKRLCWSMVEGSHCHSPKTENEVRE